MSASISSLPAPAPAPVPGATVAAPALHPEHESMRLYQSLPDGLVIVRDGRVRYANPAALRLLGAAAPEQVVGSPVERFVHPAQAAFVQRRLCGERAHDSLPPAEFDCVRLDGSTLRVEVSATGARFEGQAALHLFVRDASEKTLQRTLLEHEKWALELIAKGAALETVLARLCLAVEQSLPQARCAVMLRDESGARLLHGAAPSLPPAYCSALHGIVIDPLTAGSCGAAAHGDALVVAQDIASDPRWEAFRALAASAGLAACWSAPFHRPDGAVGGTFAVYRRTPGHPSAADLRLMATFAHLCAVALHQHVVREALRRSRLRHESVLQAVGAAVLVFADDGTPLSVNAGAEALFGRPQAELLGMPMSRIFAGAVDAAGAPITHESCPATRCLRTHAPQRDLVMGLLDASGARRWTSLNVHPVPGDGPHGVDAVVCSLTDVTAMKLAHEQLAEQAHRDDLTGLPNRACLNARVEQALAAAGGERVAMLVIDLDGFKHVNDTLGHAAGDALLVELARRLGQACGADLLARRSGDEFVLLMREAVGPGTVEQAAQRLREALHEPFAVRGQEIYVTAAFGAAIHPDHAGSAEELFRRADAAMYQAKRLGPNRLVVHSPDDAQQCVNRVALDAQLHRALERGQFVLHYQPRFAAAGGALAGVEALVRWNHPQRGLVGPGEFIGLAEDTGLILELGQWVLAEACRQGAAWRAAGLALPAVSVNVSTKQIGTALFAEAIPRILADTGFPIGCLELEVTETAMLTRNDPAALEALAALRRRGLRVLLDDFGTGYSSLSYLQRFPLDGLKIDRSFVARLPEAPEACAITRAIVDMAKALGLSVVAEGVERDAQRMHLAALGCDELQGFLLGRPMTADALLQAFGPRD